MIPESAGATPYGIFQLAEGFRHAAVATMSARMLTSGPTRLLAYHSCELYLKAYLKHQAERSSSFDPMVMTWTPCWWPPRTQDFRTARRSLLN